MKEKEPIILVGGGGHCHSVIEAVESSGQFQIMGIIDVPKKFGNSVLGYEVIGNDRDIPRLAQKCPNFIVTAGQLKSAELRKKMYTNIKEAGGRLPVIIASTAYVSKHAMLGEGTVVMHQAFINANARAGKNCIINTSALLEHDTAIGDHCHISTHAVVNGGVSVGNETMVGSNSVLVQGITIGERAVVGAGSTVIRNVESGEIAYGNPAKVKI